MISSGALARKRTERRLLQIIKGCDVLRSESFEQPKIPESKYRHFGGIKFAVAASTRFDV